MKSRANRVLRFVIPSFCLIAVAACGLLMDNEDLLNRASAAFVDDDFRAAIIDSKEVLRKEPDNLRGRLLLGRALVAVGDGAAAEKELRRSLSLGVEKSAIVVDLGLALQLQDKAEEIVDEISIDLSKSQSDRVAIQAIRGSALLRLGQPSQARALFELVLDVEPANTEAKLGIVSTHVSEQDFRQARITMDEVVTTHPDNLSAWLASGALDLMTNNAIGAESGFENALTAMDTETPLMQRVRALDGLANALLLQGKLDETRDVARKMHQAVPESAVALLLSARIAYEDQEWSMAEDYLLRVLQFVPDHSSAQMLLGAVHLRTGHLSQAEMYLSAVVSTLPENREARQLLAEARLQRARMADAQQVLRPMLQSGSDPLSLSLAARASAGLGNTDDALGYLKQALVADPGSAELQFQLAMTHLSSGDVNGARAVLQDMNTSDSEGTAFRRDAMLVLTRVRENDLGEAVSAAQLLTERWPDVSNAHIVLGALLLSQRDMKNARHSFQAAAELSDYSPLSRRYLALLDEFEGDLESAKSHYEQILERAPDTTWAMASMARIAGRQSDFDSSRSWTEKLLKVDPDNAQQQMILARQYLSAGEYEKAVSTARVLVEIDASNAEAHNELALALAASDDFLAASNSFRRAADLDPDTDEYRLNLARAQLRQGNPSAAEQTLLVNERVDLNNITGAVMLAEMRSKDDDPEGAMQIITQLKAAHPKSPIPYAAEAELLLRNGDQEAASDAYDVALVIEPQQTHALRSHAIRRELQREDADAPLLQYLASNEDSEKVRMALAGYYQASGKNGAAMSQYERVLGGDPRNVVALNNLAWLYFRDKDRRAEELARRAREIDPKNGSVADTLGWILVQNGSLVDGVAVLRDAEALSPDNPEIDFHLAYALAQQGAAREARSILQRTLSSAVSFGSRAEAEKLLASL